MTDFPELPPPSDRMRDLTEAERLVVACFRRWLADGAQREMLWRSLAYELDPGEARAALRGLEAMIRVLTAHAHRNIAYHHPCCPCVGPDEVALLTLVTAVQREQPTLARLVARSLVHGDGVELTLAAAGVFAAALTRASLTLPLRFAYCADAGFEAAPQPERAETVH